MTDCGAKSGLVSAIVSTYNAERFLRGKLEDLEAQSIAHQLEIIVIDSGSPQNERAIVEEFQGRYDNISYLRTKRRETVYQAWNRGIRMATGEFVTNANTDDRLRRDALETMVRALREHPECVLAYPDMRITMEENASFERHEPFGFRDWPEFDRLSLLELCCVGPFPLWRRSLHDAIGYFDERFKSAADYEFWLRAALNHDFIHVPEFLGLYWLSPETVSRKGDLPTLEYLQVQKEYRPRFAPLTPAPVELTPGEQDHCRTLIGRAGQGDPGALAELERFTQLYPRSPQPHHELGEIHFKNGEIGLAKKHFEKAAILDPASANYRDKLQAFLKSELYQSLQHQTANAGANPGDLETQLAAGMILVLLERFEAARAHYLRALDIDPESAPARGNLAFLDRKTGRVEPDQPADYYGFRRPEVQRLVSRRARSVLDVGCASGEVGGGIRRRQGASVWGVEPNPQAAAAAASVLDRVLQGSIEEVLPQLPERGFDSIILADVLEHLVDPGAVLTALSEKLAPAGEIIVTLPNVRHWSVLRGLLEGSWDYQEAGILDRTHLRFFTRRSAVDLFEGAGYAVSQVTPIALKGETGMPERLMQALRQGGVESPTLAAESAVYQYLFRLQRKEALLTSIVMLTFNELDCTRECLESIERNTPEPHEVILVDNGSSDGTLPYLRELCAGKSGYRLIENGENLGFAAGCNIGMRQAKGGRILLLNNDVVVTRGWLAGMIDSLEREPGAGIAGPMTNEIAGPQRVPEAGYRSMAELEDFAGSFRGSNFGRRIPAERVVGFCMLFGRQVLEAVGELDTRFGSGNFEDDDFCLRAALAGFGCVIAGDVFIHHYGSRSFAGNGIDYAAAMARNRRAFDEKWHLAALDRELAARVVTRNALSRGGRLARQGRLNQAVDLLLQEGIRFSPASPGPYLALARILAEAGSYQNALEVLAEMPPGEALQSTLLQGFCRMETGDPEQAGELAEKALSLDPESAQALHLKGTLAAGRGEAADADQLFRRAIAADLGFAPSYSALAALAWQRGDQGEALQLAELGFVLAPLDMAALARYHDYATTCDALAREEQRVREARAIHPEHKGLAYGLIEILIRRGAYREALDEIERGGVEFGLDDAAIDAALQIRKLAGPVTPAAKGCASVSVCMIVKDEAEHLPAALLSAKALGQEIVVVDTGSGDRSADIALLFGARVYHFPWNGSFSEARNFSLSKAQGDYIFVLDADERLAPADLPPLSAMLKRSATGTAYSFTTRNYTAEITRKNWSANAGEYPDYERGRGWTPSEKVRLFPNDGRLRFEGRVHELLEASLIRCGIPIHACDVPVHHYGKLDPARNAEKQESYYLLGLKKLAESGASVESLAELALQATELKRFQEAEGLWHRLLEARPDSAEAYFNLGYLHLSTGEYRKARAHALKGAGLAPAMKEAAFNLAKCELFLGNTDRALVSCREMLGKWPDYPPALSLFCACLLIAGQSAEAQALVQRLAGMQYDCADFLQEYAAGLKRGERGDLALPLVQLADQIAAGGPRP